MRPRVRDDIEGQGGLRPPRAAVVELTILAIAILLVITFMLIG